MWVATGFGAVVFLVGAGDRHPPQALRQRRRRRARRARPRRRHGRRRLGRPGRALHRAAPHATSTRSPNPRAPGTRTKGAARPTRGLEAEHPRRHPAGHHHHHGGRGLTPSPNGPVRRRRSWRAAIALPLLLALGACAENAPLDTLEPKGPEAADDRQPRATRCSSSPASCSCWSRPGCCTWPGASGSARTTTARCPPRSTATPSWSSAGPSSRPCCSPASAVPPCSPSSTSTRRPADAMEVTVIGQQWWWEYRYDVDHDGQDDIITANDLVIPAGEPVNLTITSRDVIHSFWIPALNGKRDAVPGREHPLLIEADEPGVFRGQCTEFCGLSHGYMRMRVVALTQADYAAWQANQLRGRRSPTEGELALRGPRDLPHDLLPVPPRPRRGGQRRAVQRRRPRVGRRARPHPLRQPRHVRRRRCSTSGSTPTTAARSTSTSSAARSTSPTSRPGCATRPARSRWPPPRAAGHAQPGAHRGADR